MNKYFLLIFTLFFVSLVRAAHRDLPGLSAARLLVGMDFGVEDPFDVEVYVGPESPVGFGLISPVADLAGPESPPVGLRLESSLADSLGLGSPLANLDGLELVNPADQAAGAQGLKSRVVSTAFSGYNGQQPEKKQQPQRKKQPPKKKQQPKKKQPPKKKQLSFARKMMDTMKKRQQVQDEERCLAGEAVRILRRRAALVKEGHAPQDAKEMERSDRRAVAKLLAQRAAERNAQCAAKREEKK